MVATGLINLPTLGTCERVVSCSVKEGRRAFMSHLVLCTFKRILYIVCHVTLTVKKNRKLKKIIFHQCYIKIREVIPTSVDQVCFQSFVLEGEDRSSPL